jgi:poly-gamma-glutamate capsule biosynthesis protein CapA/YwtB (metallophosphatase superfamily)
MHKLIKIIIILLFGSALVFGFMREHSNFFGSKTLIQKFPSPSDDSLNNYYVRGQQFAKESEAPSSTVTFLAVGDVMLSRNVALKTQTSDNNAWPFLGLSDLFKSVDFSFGNLETPVSENKGTVGGHSLIFNSPKEYVSELAKAGFKIVNLANNHAMDQGKKGLEYTLEFLNTVGIKHVGTGNSLSQAWQPAIVEQNGIKICFVGASYSSINDSGATKNDFVARIQDLENLKLSVESCKKQSDFTVVTMHAGIEYKRNPNQAQIDFAHSAIDFGADLVIGAHPHWIQTIEKYCPVPPSPPFQGGVSPEALAKGDGVVGAVEPSAKTTSPASTFAKAMADKSQGLLLEKEESSASCQSPKYIFYSLGNFIFDQNFSQDTKEGLTLKITISRNTCHPERSEGSLSNNQQRDSSAALGMVNNGACADDLQGQKAYANLDQIELIPVIIENSQPRSATQEEAKKILQKIGEFENVLLPN